MTNCKTWYIIVRNMKRWYMSVKELAKMYGINEEVARRWCRLGRVNAKKIGKQWYIKKEKDYEKQ